jgi:hypothetical protein
VKLADIPQLSFEEADELIDSQVKFISREYEWNIDYHGQMFNHFSAWPRTGNATDRGNIARLIVSLVDDDNYSGLKEDADGYADASNASLGGFNWIPKEWSDEQVDDYLRRWLGLDSTLDTI